MSSNANEPQTRTLVMVPPVATPRWRLSQIYFGLWVSDIGYLCLAFYRVRFTGYTMDSALNQNASCARLCNGSPALLCQRLCQCRTRRFCLSQRLMGGETLEKQAAAAISNKMPGSTGRKSPMRPKIRKKTPRQTSSKRLSIVLVLVTLMENLQKILCY